MTETPAAPSMAELLGADAPSNWGKWGPDDEVGSLNYLDAAQVLRGTRHIVSGEVFTLQLADACAADGRWTFLYPASPLHVVEGTGAPVNPVVIR